MLAECGQDLMTKVQAVSAFAASTSFILGGTLPDPGATKIALPAAWILHKKAKNTRDNEPAIGLPSQNINALLTYVVALYLQPTNQAAVQLPLLQAVMKAIHGTTSPSGHRWYWESHELAAFNVDRMIYPLFFSVDASI